MGNKESYCSGLKILFLSCFIIVFINFISFITDTVEPLRARFLARFVPMTGQIVSHSMHGKVVIMWIKRENVHVVCSTLSL